MGRNWVAIGFCWNVIKSMGSFRLLTLQPPKSDLHNQRIRDHLKRRHHDREYQKREIEKRSCSSWLYVQQNFKQCLRRLFLEEAGS